MDARVDDFLNEINEIAPLKKNKQYLWQECYDELTGYTYYWNTKTDEVTWEAPSEYKPLKEKGPPKEKTVHSPKEKNVEKKLSGNSLYIPPRTAPLFPSTSQNLSEIRDNIKIYRIREEPQVHAPKTLKKSEQSSMNKPKFKKPRRSSSDSEDEKIVMISSYGDSDSETDDDHRKNVDMESKNSTSTLNESNFTDEEDDGIDILTKIQNRAKELKRLGGKVPSPVKKIVNDVEKSQKPSEQTKEDRGLSLIAGYSDSEEEFESESPNLPAQLATVEPKVSHSTLFPISKPIDIREFETSNADVKKDEEEKTSPEFDTKMFQRKRRIGIDLVNTVKKAKDKVEETEENERQGFGFSKDTAYSSFLKGGVMFVKSDILNPPKQEESGSNESDPKPQVVDEETTVKRKDVEDLYHSLKEKLGFLSEGRSPVSPVQVMIIQAETLSMAIEGGGLKLSYFQKWLNDTCSDLIKLEKETAPEGWLLQWDRSNKRYYYQNQATGETQWEYPQPDVVRCDEAMDICTTPPPVGVEPEICASPPLPPTIRSPTPPPPPIISIDVKPKKEQVQMLPDVPLPPEPEPATVKYVENGEPLPPGVDLPEMISYSKPKEMETSTNVNVPDQLNTALDSFYSDIAAIETTNASPVSLIPDNGQPELVADTPDATKKKKKTKVKLTQGLAMKKKGVSKLVEKWKNVQMSLND